MDGSAGSSSTNISSSSAEVSGASESDADVEPFDGPQILWQSFEFARFPPAAAFPLDHHGEGGEWEVYAREQYANADTWEDEWDEDHRRVGDQYRGRIDEVERADRLFEVIAEIETRHRQARAQRVLQDVAILRAHHLGVHKDEIVPLATMSRTTLYTWLPKTQEFIAKLRTDARFVVRDWGPVLICKGCDEGFAVGQRLRDTSARWWDQFKFRWRSSWYGEDPDGEYWTGFKPEESAMVFHPYALMFDHWQRSHDWAPNGRESAPNEHESAPPEPSEDVVRHGMSAEIVQAEDGRILACGECEATGDAVGHCHTGTYPAMHEHWRTAHGWNPSKKGTPKPSDEYLFELGDPNEREFKKRVDSEVLLESTRYPTYENRRSRRRKAVQSMRDAFPDALDSGTEALLAEVATSADHQYNELANEVRENEENIQRAQSALTAIADHAQEQLGQELRRNMAVLEAQRLGLSAAKIAKLVDTTATTVRNWRLRAEEFADKLRQDTEIQGTDDDGQPVDPSLVCRLCGDRFLRENTGEYFETTKHYTDPYAEMHQHWRTAHDWRPGQEGESARSPSGRRRERILSQWGWRRR